MTVKEIMARALKDAADTREFEPEIPRAVERGHARVVVELFLRSGGTVERTKAGARMLKGNAPNLMVAMTHEYREPVVKLMQEVIRALDRKRV